MKKLILLLSLVFTLSISSFSQSESAFNVHGGYSWLNGVVGAEYQMGYLAISAGYFPAKSEDVSSFSAAFTTYSGNWYQSSCYLSGGIASAGYRYQSLMGIAMLGYKYGSETFNAKLGFGYGWCKYVDVFTWELTIGYAFGVE